MLSIGRAMARMSLSASCSCFMMHGRKMIIDLACGKNTPPFRYSCKHSEVKTALVPAPRIAGSDGMQAESTSSWLPAEVLGCRWPCFSPVAGPAQPAAFLVAPAHRVLPVAELQDAPEHQLLHAHALALQIGGEELQDAVQLCGEVHPLQHLQHRWL